MKIKIGNQLIDKELEIINAKSLSNPELPATHLTIEEDTKLGLFDKEDWFTYYKFNTEEQYEEWKAYCLKKHSYEDFQLFNLMFGLKKNY